jgi:dTDP-4-amino-4,6-dideoxygalactose transaminase
VTASTTMTIPFNRPFRTGEEGARVAQAIDGGWTGGSGPFTARCEELLRQMTGAAGVLLTHSCTGALEMAALLSDVGPGDEVIVPSFTFVSTASAFALRGATPVFVDVEPDTLCLDPARVVEAITARTRVIVPVHYAGVGADMASLGRLAGDHDLLLIEDAAQGIGATRDGAALGAIGDLGALSFHETKNVSCGEGGALLMHDTRWSRRAEILREKGTNRASFDRGEVDKYTWVDVGSSFLMGDITAAILLCQLERVAEATRSRRRVWQAYHDGLAPLERAGLLRRPAIPPGAEHNAHIYFVRVVGGRAARDELIGHLAARGIAAYFHYVPLHSSPVGRRLGRVHGPMDVTNSAANDLVRLPLWTGLRDEEIDRVVEEVGRALGR